MDALEEWSSLDVIDLHSYELSTLKQVRNAKSKYVLKGRNNGSVFRLKKVDGTFVTLTIDDLVEKVSEPVITKETDSNDEPITEKVNLDNELKEIVNSVSKEIWKSLNFLGFSKYEISDSHNLRNVSTHKLLEGSGKRGDWKIFQLTDDEGKLMKKRRSRLMMEAFVGPIPQDGMTVDHINRIRDDDRIANLRYATKSEQCFNRGKYVKKSKIIMQFSDGVHINTFLSAKKSLESIGATSGCIASLRKACKSKGSYRGYEWAYQEDFDEVSEVWKDGTDRFPELLPFLVSQLGRIRRESGTTYGHKDDNGYKTIDMGTVDGSHKGMKVSRLICGVFSGERREDIQVNHINGNKDDNSFKNLEYATGKENCIHAHSTGLTSSQKAVIQLTMDDSFIAEFVSMNEAQRQTGINHSLIGRVCNGKASYTGEFKWKYSDETKRIKSHVDLTKSSIEQLDKEGNVIRTFSSMIEVTRILPIARSALRKVCQGKLKSCKGMYFRYTNLDDINRIGSVGKPVNQLSLDGDFIARFLSASDAEFNLNCNSGNISAACRSGGVSNGYRFEYA